LYHMIFRLGPLPDTPEFTPVGNWTTVHEPSLWGFQLRAIPIAIVATALFTFLWIVLTPVLPLREIVASPLPILRNVACLVGTIVVHELLHAVVHPNFGLSKQSVIGFWPSRMFVYTVYTHELTKSRCLVILMVPFVIISVLPLIYSTITQTASIVLGYISVVNALLASGDMAAAIMTARLIPKGSTIRTKGWTTYYRKNRHIDL
jgi:hypothetical protein